MSDLQLLFDNKIDCIIEDQLLSAEQIATFLNVLEKQPEWKEASIPQVHEHLFEKKPDNCFYLNTWKLSTAEQKPSI